MMKNLIDCRDIDFFYIMVVDGAEYLTVCDRIDPGSIPPGAYLYPVQDIWSEVGTWDYSILGRYPLPYDASGHVIDDEVTPCSKDKQMTLREYFRDYPKTLWDLYMNGDLEDDLVREKLAKHFGNLLWDTPNEADYEYERLRQSKKISQ